MHEQSAFRTRLAQAIAEAVRAKGGLVVSVEARYDVPVILCEFGGERHHIRIVDVRGTENDQFVNAAEMPA